jgi:16S rRNA (guanine527-N7)-methyltransferase
LHGDQAGVARANREASEVLQELIAAGEPVDGNALLPLFAGYLARVQQSGESMNLVSTGDRARIGRRHLLESFNVLAVPGDWAVGPLCDAGSGAGFPGLPLAMLFPALPVVLVESVRKKARFLSETVAALGLEGRVTVLAERVEDVAQRAPWRGSFAIVTARGLGPLERSLPWCAPLLRAGGHLVAFKGTHVDRELAGAAEVARRAQLELRDLIPMRWGEGNMVVFRRRGGKNEQARAAGDSPADCPSNDQSSAEE